VSFEEDLKQEIFSNGNKKWLIQIFFLHGNENFIAE